jgi:hypothetical protein
MLFCTTNRRSSGISQRAKSSLHSITDCAAIASLRGPFLSALRFRVAVIFRDMDRTLAAPRGSLPNRAPASASLGFVRDGLVMSVPSDSLVATRCSHTVHASALGVWSLETFDLLKESV